MKKLCLIIASLIMFCGCGEDKKTGPTGPPFKYERSENPVSSVQYGPFSNLEVGRQKIDGSFSIGKGGEGEVVFLMIAKISDVWLGERHAVGDTGLILPDKRLAKYIKNKTLLILGGKDETFMYTYIDMIPLEKGQKLIDELEKLKSSDDYFKLTVEVLGKDRFDASTLDFLVGH